MTNTMKNSGPVEIRLVGGFLGSGKTTAISRIAAACAADGRRVGIITNDQAEGLVDTATFRSQGWNTEEISGGCFCCRFDDLLSAADRILERHRPDILLCEPVGSCTDIVATVIRPLQELHGDRFSVAPYVVLLDPERARRALTGTGAAGFGAKVSYIYQMQQNEATVIAINKADTLGESDRAELQALVERTFPNAEVMMVSARTGEGFDRLMARMDRTGKSQTRSVDVNYDEYAEGEAALGWLNAEYVLESQTVFQLDAVLLDLAGRIDAELKRDASEPAHVKLLLQCDVGSARANIVSSFAPPELSVASGACAKRASLIINARVEESPSQLARVVGDALSTVAVSHDLVISTQEIRTLSPGRPTPTHRILDHV